MKTYLVERYSTDIKLDTDSVVVALTPEACHQLAQAGIKYTIVEDYYDELKLSAGVDEYYESQLRWVDSLDEFLQNNVWEVKGFKLKLGTIHYFFFKTMILDPLYIRCYALNRLFESIKPSSVTLVSHPPEEKPLDFRLESNSNSYFSQVIPLLCNQRNIPITTVFLEQPGTVTRKIKSARTIRDLINWFEEKLYNSTTIRGTYFTYKGLGRRLFSRREKHKRLNILILEFAYIEMGLAIEAIGKGHNVYQLSDNSIFKYSLPLPRRCLSLKTKDKENSIWENTASLLEGHDLIKWVNEKCQLDVSPIVLPKLKYFVSSICPEILEYLKVFIDFYQKAKLDFIITSHGVSPIDFAAVAAASHEKHLKTVCLCRGASSYDSKFWRITELSEFDILITSSQEEKEYSSYLRQANNLPTRIYSSADRLLAVKETGYLRESSQNSVRKNRIIYLPTFMMWDARRMEGDSYPDTWYYEFQKALLEYFSTKKEYTFVWKELPVTNRTYNPIPLFIRDRGFRNIEVATNPFPQHLPYADRVICDYPSTGFYESVVAGVPTLSLYHRSLIVRKSAVDYFGNLLKPFTDVSEAIKHIEEFLSSDPELYKTTIDVEDNSILDILEEVGRKAN